jgi:ABC-type antimicrobial peptide transport system permease subunit
MASFAAVALLLAVLGLYGVLTYTVRQRTQEIGIRIALGASRAQVRALVLRQAALVLGIGLLCGLVGALLLGRWLSSLVVAAGPPRGHDRAAHDDAGTLNPAARIGLRTLSELRLRQARSDSCLTEHGCGLVQTFPFVVADLGLEHVAGSFSANDSWK